MKFFNLVLLSSLILFAAACGKDNKSGSGSNGYFSAVNTASLTQDSQNALNSYKNWYNNPSEASTSLGLYKLTYTTSNANNSGCELKDITVFGVVIGQYYYCGSSSSSGSNSSCSVAILAQQPNQNLKTRNVTLAKIANGQAGTLVSASFTGSVYSLQFQKSSGHIVTYVVDTRYHSAMQPVQMTDTETSVYSYLSNIQQGGTTGLPVCE